MPQTTIWRGSTWRTHTRRRCARRSATQRLAGHTLLAYRVAPLVIQIVIAMVLLVTVWAALNWMVQVVRKPSEVLFPVSGSLFKAPAQTWREYGPLFETHSTTVVTPELLASLAQMEGTATPWREPIGGGGSVGTHSKCTGRPQARSACFRVPTAPSRKPDATAFVTTSWSRTALGTTRGRAGSTRSTRA